MSDIVERLAGYRRHGWPTGNRSPARRSKRLLSEDGHDPGPMASSACRPWRVWHDEQTASSISLT
jgi:hypothetical protein